jgi:hypothetical protein
MAMGPDWKALEELQQAYDAQHPLTIEEKFALLNGMYELAGTLGVFPLKDPWDGFDEVLRLSRILKSVG